MELVFSKVAACNFGLLHFLKQWGEGVLFICSFAESFFRIPLTGASVTKTDQKKQKDILRKNTAQIFLLKHNGTKKQK